MPRAHANKYLEPDAELGRLGVAACQQLLQACELGLLSFCAAWLLHTHTANIITDTLGHSLFMPYRHYSHPC